MIDRDIKLSLPMDSILDLIYQLKADRAKVVLELEQQVQSMDEMRRRYEDRENSMIQTKQELEYENLKLRSKVIELENKIALCERKSRLMLPIPKELP